MKPFLLWNIIIKKERTRKNFIRNFRRSNREELSFGLPKIQKAKRFRVIYATEFTKHYAVSEILVTDLNLNPDHIYILEE